MRIPNAVGPYARSWPADFRIIADALKPFLAEIPHNIEHVGSTSVPGLAAKPIIDLDVIVPTAKFIEPGMRALENAGYTHQGNLGITGREAFAVMPGLPYHHLYLVLAQTKPHSDHIVLRDYLRSHPAAAERYAAVKGGLSGLLSVDRERYQDGKREVIENLLDEARAHRRLRESCRGLILDDGDRVLLAEHKITGGTVWVPPGGGVEAGESLQQALARELFEETGLLLAEGETAVEIWRQTTHLEELFADGYAGVLNHFFLVRIRAFVPDPGAAAGQPGHPFEEGILTLRWWTPAQIQAASLAMSDIFSPRRLGVLLEELLLDESRGELAADPLDLDVL